MRAPLPLTTREKQVLRLCRNGLIPKQIARELRTSYHTVKNHLTNIRHKLGAKDTHQAVLIDYVMQEYLGEP